MNDGSPNQENHSHTNTTGQAKSSAVDSYVALAEKWEKDAEEKAMLMDDTEEEGREMVAYSIERVITTIQKHIKELRAI